MKIATRALLTLLIISALTISSGGMNAVAVSDEFEVSSKRNDRLEKLQRHHDRKLELRASILGVSPQKLKEEMKESSFERILKKHGFKSKRAFVVALNGKIKDELKRRGWSDSKLKKILQKKTNRLERKLS